MAEKTLIISQWNGGISSRSRSGYAGAFRFGRGLDIHDDPDVLKVQPACIKDSGTTVVDLILFASTNTVNTNIYFIGNAGKVYKRAGGVWSVLSTLSNAQGMGFFSGTNLIYLVSGNTQYKLNPSDDNIDSHRNLNSADYHPVEAFLDKVFTGNGRELISTDGSGIDYSSSTIGGGIKIDYNYKIKCLKNLGNWLFIGATSDNSSDARYFLWDGFSEKYNFSKSLKGEDGINACEINDDGTVLIFAGKKGNIYQLTGIDEPLKPIKTLPRIEEDKTIEVYPGATVNFKGDLIFGTSAGTSITAERGVYSWVSNSPTYPKVLNLDYTISTGTETGAGLQIGSLLVPNSTDLFIAWKDGSNYGVDKVDGTGVQSPARYESLLHNDGLSNHIKTYKQFDIKLARVLASGQTITLSYKADGGSWTSIGTLDFAVDGAISQKTFKKDILAYTLEIKLTKTNSGSTTTEIDSVETILETEPLL